MALAGVGEALASVVLKEVSLKLGSAVGQQIKARWNLERDMEEIKSTLGIVQAVLRDAERRSVREEAVNLWLKMLKDAAYEISDMFDEFEVKLTKGKISSSVAKLTMGKKLKNMREKLTKIAAQRTQFAFNLDASSTDHEEIKKRQTTSKINRATIVGRQKEKDDIVTLLKSDEEQETLVIPIFGFGGIGKTTLAKLVFNDDQMQDFDLRVWVYVSPHFDLEMIGKSIISQFKQPVEGLDGLQSVSNCLEETLGGRSCLIVLDDVWESNFFQLDNLRLMLSNIKEKSKIRIIVTTRTEEVARNIGTVTPYKLKPLSDDHCWTLFKHMAFQSGFSCREDKNALDKIGWDIAKKCQGVPMAVQAVGFMLRNKSVEEWRNVRDSDIWDGSSTTDMLPSLKLSYYQMTDYLKLCFSYCSVFPKGCEIHRGDLIQQWISLGFIPSSPGEQLTLEKIGENYVNELLGMSFLQYSRPTSLVTKEDTHNSMLLSMHDLIHDLARSVLGDELLFVDGKKGYTSRNGNHRYALVVNGTRQIDLCDYVPTKLRSLHIFYSAEIHPSLYSKSLRVLDLSMFSSGSFPASIGKLKQLRYLGARGMQHESVPEDVTSLSKLMYLNISGSSKISMLPDSVKALRSLLHLDLSGSCNLSSLPESFGDLINLSHLNLANCSLLKALPESVNKLRSLLHLDLSGCCNLCSLPESFGDLENLSHLNLANCSLFKALPKSVNKLRSLVHLDLSGCCNLCSLPESFGDLTNLTDLNLGNCIHLNTLPDSVNKLRNLFRLDLSGCCNLCSLPESSGDLMDLSHLYLANCSLLKTLPESVDKLKSLLHLDLSGCSSLCSLPESFGELINLSHLNLAKCTDLCSLPKSFGRLCELQYLNLSDCLRLGLWFDIVTLCCLTKLQYLNLSRCPSLMRIPESINNLKNLHTLDLSRCHWIERFPESLCGMASLKFLLIHECGPWLQQRLRESQLKNHVLMLPKFIVQRTDSGTSSNISRLQSVYPAELEIVCLENVTSIEEVDAVNLAGKSILSKLALAWTPAAERFLEDEALLQGLQPPENLMFIKVQGYMATSFSGWMMCMESCLLHLVCIEMVDLPRCEQLPVFGQLPNLERLILKRMPIFRKLGTEICGGSGAFKKLKEFTLVDLDTLEEWITKVPLNGEFMFPSLNKLEICGCPKLRLTPCLPRAIEWRIQASDEIIASQYDAGSPSSLTLSKLHVTSCQLQPNQWALLGFLPALEVLEISNYGLGKLPDGISFLVSLRSLKIDLCFDGPKEQFDWSPFLSAISGDGEVVMFPLTQLTALENYEISFNNELQTWCKKHDRWTLQPPKTSSGQLSLNDTWSGSNRRKKRGP
ncbi:putative disease resistance protein RGA3 isoform X1 [Miscanthus floridulus]|uniref:putative disease resistance protein RGA3 isoform X1 n=1 Tax=Miscanthus floridulus TaxID=154761 RepID=UPI00345B3414